MEDKAIFSVLKNSLQNYGTNTQVEILQVLLRMLTGKEGTPILTDKFTDFSRDVRRVVEGDKTKWVQNTEEMLSQQDCEFISHYENGPVVFKLTFEWFCETIRKLREVDFKRSAKIIANLIGQEEMIKHFLWEPGKVIRKIFIDQNETEVVTFQLPKLNPHLFWSVRAAPEVKRWGDESLGETLIKYYLAEKKLRILTTRMKGDKTQALAKVLRVNESLAATLDYTYDRIKRVIPTETLDAINKFNEQPSTWLKKATDAVSLNKGFVQKPEMCLMLLMCDDYEDFWNDQRAWIFREREILDDYRQKGNIQAEIYRFLLAVGLLNLPVPVILTCLDTGMEKPEFRFNVDTSNTDKRRNPKKLCLRMYPGNRVKSFANVGETEKANVRLFPGQRVGSKGPTFMNTSPEYKITLANKIGRLVRGEKPQQDDKQEKTIRKKVEKYAKESKHNIVYFYDQNSTLVGKSILLGKDYIYLKSGRGLTDGDARSLKMLDDDEIAKFGELGDTGENLVDETFEDQVLLETRQPEKRGGDQMDTTPAETSSKKVIVTKKWGEIIKENPRAIGDFMKKFSKVMEEKVFEDKELKRLPPFQARAFQSMRWVDLLVAYNTNDPHWVAKMNQFVEKNFLGKDTTSFSQKDWDEFVFSSIPGVVKAPFLTQEDVVAGKAW